MRFTGYSFGSIRVDGVTYDHDLIIDHGKIRKRKKAASRKFRSEYGHTPLSAAEDIPWRCRRLVIGTGADGALPVMQQVRDEARRRKVDLVILPTAEAIDALAKAPADQRHLAPDLLNPQGSGAAGPDPCYIDRLPTRRSARRMAPADSEYEPRLSTEEDLQAISVGKVIPHNAPVTLAEYDPQWPALFDREAARIRAVLGDAAVRVEHVGSTSVPGLATKPIIDILQAVPDSADEQTYAPALEAAGYVPRIREPDWFEHRLFKGPDTNINLHVFTVGAAEIDRMLLFRDWLRADDADRAAYLQVKRDLAQRTWRHVQHYADSKTAIVQQIMARASAASQQNQPG